jgi:hypothetical protein
VAVLCHSRWRSISFLGPCGLLFRAEFSFTGIKSCRYAENRARKFCEQGRRPKKGNSTSLSLRENPNREKGTGGLTWPFFIGKSPLKLDIRPLSGGHFLETG